MGDIYFLNLVLPNFVLQNIVPQNVKINFKKKKNNLCSYGEGAVTDPKCQKWFAKFLGTTDILAK